MNDRSERFASLLCAACGAAFLLLLSPPRALSQPPAPAEGQQPGWWNSARPGQLAGDRQMEPEERARRLVVRNFQTGTGFRLDLDLPLFQGGTPKETDDFSRAVIRRFEDCLPELQKPLAQLRGGPPARATIRLEGFQSLGDLLSLEFLCESPTPEAGAALKSFGINWSFSRSRELELRSLFRPGAPWLDALAQACTETLRRRLSPEQTGRPPAWYQRGIQPDEGEFRNWVVGRGCVTILFDGKELTGQEESGPQQVEVPFSQLAGLIDPAGPLGWAVSDGATEAGCVNLSCHPGFPGDWQVVHPALGKGCPACHPPYLAGKLHPVKTPFGPTCLSCHTALGEAVRAAASVHAPVREGKCIVCHDPHGINGRASHRLLKFDPVMEEGAGERLDLPASIEKFCVSCHPQVMRPLSLSAGATDFRAGTRNLHMLHGRNEKLRSCLLCHDPHAASSAHLLREAFPSDQGGEPYPIDYRPTAKGGTCRPGCHREREFVR
jgi:hypothetical protein